jgi:hypothetical protein
MTDINFYYIVESEILKNTQWDIFHIFTSEDIDHMTFSIYTIFCLGLYNKQNNDFYLLVLNTIFYSLAALVRKILFSPLKEKSYIRAAV